MTPSVAQEDLAHRWRIGPGLKVRVGLALVNLGTLGIGTWKNNPWLPSEGMVG